MITLTKGQLTMLAQAQAATFGQLRQQHLTNSERRDCAVLVDAGLMNNVVGTTFMLTDIGSKRLTGRTPRC